MELVNLKRYFDMMPNIAVFCRADIYQQIKQLHTCNSDAVQKSVFCSHDECYKSQRGSRLPFYCYCAKVGNCITVLYENLQNRENACCNSFKRKVLPNV